ncbi:MAG: AAA family ATPase, partial [Aeriscardovia sp.]|nr:AAA family ATPase [Aeriscardovia sp.]
MGLEKEKKMKPEARLLSSLDPCQKEAAKQREGTLCLIAGAGSGKTMTVTSRIAFALEEGVWNPSKTAAIAFSNQAALSLRSKLSSMTEKKIRVSTFHSLAFSQLRRL